MNQMVSWACRDTCAPAGLRPRVVVCVCGSAEHVYGSVCVEVSRICMARLYIASFQCKYIYTEKMQ